MPRDQRAVVSSHGNVTSRLQQSTAASASRRASVAASQNSSALAKDSAKRAVNGGMPRPGSGAARVPLKPVNGTVTETGRTRRTSHLPPATSKGSGANTRVETFTAPHVHSISPSNTGEKATHVSASLPTPTAAPDMDAVQDSELRVSVERAVVWTPRTASTRTSQDLTEAEEVMAMLRSVQFSLTSASTDSAAGWSQAGCSHAPASPIPHVPPTRSVTAAMMASSLVASSIAPFSAAATSASFVSSADSGDLADFDEFTREVAARVIQFYWRQKHPVPASLAQDAFISAVTDNAGSLLVSSTSPDETASFTSMLPAAVELGQTMEEMSCCSGERSPTASLQPPAIVEMEPCGLSMPIAGSSCASVNVPPAPCADKTSDPDVQHSQQEAETGLVSEATALPELSVPGTEFSLDAFAPKEQSVAESAVATSYTSPGETPDDLLSSVSAPPPKACVSSHLEATVQVDTPPVVTDKMSSFLEYLDAAEHSHLHGVSPADEPALVTVCASAQPKGKTVVPSLRLPKVEVVPVESRMTTSAWSEESGALLTDRSAVSSVATTATTATQKSSALAASVYDGVKSKMRDLRAQLAHKEQLVVQLHHQLEAAAAQAESAAAAATAHEMEVLSEVRVEAERQQARHLAFIDRLLADKDALTQKCSTLASDIASIEERTAERKLELTKQWAAELKKQKDGWEAAERARREAWQLEKTREVKELTIRGLEPEIQRLVAKHKAELREVNQQKQDELRRQREELNAQSEKYASGLRERLLAERDDALEKERLAAQHRLSEQAEKYQSQAQAQRMRLGGDAEAAVERMEVQRRDDKARYASDLDRLRREQDEAMTAVRRAAERESEDARRKHAVELAALKEKWETEQAAYRTHVQDRARKELAVREAALRDQFSADLDAQLEAVAERLAREADAVRAAAEKKHVTEIQQALASAAMHEAKCREASEAEKEMSGRLAAAESHMSHLRTELSAKNDTLAWMERTVTGVKEEVAAREAEIRAVYAQKEAARELKVDALEEEHKALTKRLAVLSDDSDRIRQRKDAEMEQLEARVRQTVARKDESIAALREQLSSVHTTLAHTEQVLQRQQDELMRSSGNEVH